MYDIIIIGGGSAALTAAVYATRKARKTLILAKEVGGQIAWATGVENFPGHDKIDGVELIFKLRSQAENLGAIIKEYHEVQSIEKKENYFAIKTTKGSFKSRVVIVATGRTPRKLNVPGENEFLGKGVAYCATCEAPLFRNKDVAVIGGGNAAFNAALDLLKYAKKVYILERLPQFMGDKVNLDKLKSSSKTTLVNLAEVQEISGDKFVESLSFMKGTVKKNIKVSGVFVEIGSTPVTTFLPKGVKKNKYGEIKINHKTNATSVPGVFAAGDVTDNIHKQAVVAASEGAKAAISADLYLKQIKD